jgi:sphingolipid delta-4 desaturase
MELDADIPGPREAQTVGPSTIGKTVWLAAQALILGVVRPRRLRRIPIVDRWTVTNLLVQVVAMAVLVVWVGVAPLKYLIASTVLAVGLHPLGARWIQEHFVFTEGQETYSYYGLLNRVAFNVGYHNEHHDFAGIPWNRLPKVRQLAGDAYAPLSSYRSWSGLLVRFVRDRSITLYSRITRPDGSA